MAVSNWLCFAHFSHRRTLHWPLTTRQSPLFLATSSCTFLTAAWPELRAVRSIRGEPGRSANRQAFPSSPYPALSQDLRDPHIRQAGFRVSKTTHSARRLSAWGGARACVLHRIAKDSAHDSDILSLRHDCPTLAGVSGKWSLLDGRSAMATGSFLAEPARSRHLFTAFLPGIPCACSSPRSIVTLTPPAARL